MNESSQRKLGAILSYATIAINTLIQILYTPLLIRKLGQSEYGLYSLVASIIGYLTIIDLGFGNAIVVYTSKYSTQGKIAEEKKLHGMFNIVFKIIGIIATIIGLVLYFNIDNIFGQQMTIIEIHKMKIMMLILSFNLFLSFFFAIYNSIIIAYEKFIFQKIIAIIQSLLKPLLMIPLLLLGFKSITLCVVITIVNLFTILSNYIYCRKKINKKIKYSGFDKQLFKVILGYSIWIFIGVIVDKINWSVDNFVLGAVSGTTAVAVYSIASTINQLFINLSTAISGVLLPKISKMVAQNATAGELTKEFIKVGRIQYLLVFLVASGLILVGKDFFNIWAGKGYEDAYYIALLLVLPMCIPLIQNLGISIRQAKNKHKTSSIIRLAVAIINLIISIPLSIRYGAIGAAGGTCIGLILSSILHNFYYQKVIKLDMIKFWKEITVMSIPLLIPWGVILIFKNIIKISGFLNIIFTGGIFTIIYIIVAYFFSMNEYEKRIVQIPISKLKGRKKNVSCN